MNLDDLHITTTYREIDLKQKQNELSLYFSKLLREKVGLVGSRITKSIQLVSFEEELIRLFCEENRTNLSEVIRYCFWSSGWINKDLLIAIYNTPKNILSAPGSFLNLRHDNFSYNYLEQFKDWTLEDYESAFNEASKTKTFRDHSLVIEGVEKERIKEGYPSFSYAAKQGLFDLGIYPALAITIAKQHLKVVKEQSVLTDAQIKAKEQRQKKAALARVRGDANPTQANRSKKMAISAFDFEQDHIIEPFIDALKDKGLSLSTYVKYKLIEHGIIKENMVRISDEDKLSCKEFSYERPEAEGDMEFYYDMKAEGSGSTRRINNVTVVVEAKDLIQAKLGRGFAKWVRKNCIEEAYPAIKNESVIKVFISR